MISSVSFDFGVIFLEKNRKTGKSEKNGQNGLLLHSVGNPCHGVDLRHNVWNPRRGVDLCRNEAEVPKRSPLGYSKVRRDVDTVHSEQILNFCF